MVGVEAEARRWSARERAAAWERRAGARDGWARQRDSRAAGVRAEASHLERREASWSGGAVSGEKLSEEGVVSAREEGELGGDSGGDAGGDAGGVRRLGVGGGTGGSVAKWRGGGGGLNCGNGWGICGELGKA